MGASTKVFRIFVSSPDDADVERRRVESVVSRLNGDFAGVARLETVRYETRFYQAHHHPQEQIPPATACNLVIGVFRWRLGTPMPPDFPDHMPDGRAYPSGTAYELLTSIASRQAGADLPDIYVFRFTGSAPNPPLGDPNYEKVRREWETLSAFLAEWFRAPESAFKAYFHPYAREDDFEAQVEALLRQWLANKVAGASAARWPIELNGSPFRGLDAFGAKHAPVFFGRSREVSRAVELWREAAERGAPFLLVLGPSGAGKSSFARAGLIPRLTTPGVIETVDEWRVAVMRPGDDPAGPFAALAAALFVDAKALPKDEEGRAPGLPELADSDFKTPADLAAALRHADDTAVKPILNALHRIAEATGKREAYARPLRCDLLVLVDQLDELFDPAVDASARDAFLALLAALVATGRVWVVATLRDAYYPQALASPILSGLKASGASLDVAPPGAAELAEIVRAPAEAAGLVYDKDRATGETVDQRILREADEPDMLPLVQLALTQLCDAREARDGRMILTLKAYDSLGGLKGVVDKAGKDALAGLGEAEQAKLTPLIRSLIVSVHEADGAAALATRAIPLAVAAPDAPTRKLVNALVKARLVTVAGGEGQPEIVRLVHRRVIDAWEQARKIAEDGAEFFSVQADVEEGQRKHNESKSRDDLLRGVRLAHAVKHADELPQELRGYVRASRARANRAQMLAWGVAALFAVFAIGAGIAAKIAVDQRSVAEAAKVEAQTQRDAADVAKTEAQRQRDMAEKARAQADRNFGVAEDAIQSLVFNIAQGLRNVSGMRTETVRKILETAQKAIDRLTETAPDDPALQRLRAAALDEFAGTYIAAGDLRDAASANNQSLAIARKLAAADPGDAHKQSDVSAGLERLGDVKLQSGDSAGALAVYQESLAITRKLAAADPGDARAQQDVSVSLDRLSDVMLRTGDGVGALAAYQESLDNRRKLAAADPGDAQAQRAVSVSLGRLGDVKLRNGDVVAALAAYQESLAIRRKMAAADPGDAQAQRDLSLSLERLGDVTLRTGDSAGALAAYQESLDIARKLAAADPGDARAQRGVLVSLDRLGDVKLRTSDGAGALAAYQESLAIARKRAAADPGDVQAPRDVSISLDRLGDVKRLTGDGAGALAADQESLAIRRKLAAADPGDAQAQRDVSVSLDSLGDVKLRTGDGAGALVAFRESLDIGRKLAAADPSDAQAQRDVSVSLNRLGDVKLRTADGAGALAAYQESLDIAHRLAAADPNDSQAQSDVLASLDRLGGVKLRTGDGAGALAAYQESLAIRRKMAAANPGDAQAQRDVSASLDSLGDAKFQTGDGGAALAAYQESLDIARKLAAANPGDAQAQRDVLVSLERLGNVKLRTGDGAGTLVAYQESVDIARKLAAADPGDARVHADLVVALGDVAFAAVVAGQAQEALSFADEAIALSPDTLWLYTNRADALMLLGRTDEARALYLAHRGQTPADGQSWEEDVKGDFDALRKAGITNPLMDKIEADFSRPAQPSAHHRTEGDP